MWHRPVELRQRIKDLEGQEIEVVLEKRGSIRTTQANKFYWHYLRVIEQETGNDANECHELFKRLFLPPRFISPFGKEIKIPASTTKLSKEEFSNYLDKICAHTGVPIPEI